MGYCRYCGREINYTRTVNDRWMPYDVTGQPHFCNEGKQKKNTSGQSFCQSCGKPVFRNGSKIIDYTTLTEHSCRKGDVTRYQKYCEKQKLLKPKPSRTRSPAAAAKSKPAARKRKPAPNGAKKKGAKK